MFRFSSHARSNAAIRWMQRSFSSQSPRGRVIVVGGGRMGQIRAAKVRANPRLELAALVDSSPQSLQALATLYSEATPFASLTDAIVEMGREKPVDGIILCSPTFTHEEVVKQAADHGISVFTEKPVDETASKIGRLFDCAEAAGIQLCCGFQRRFDSSYVAATQAVHNEQVGKPVMANIFFADHPCPPREFLLKGGNIFYDLSAHDVDYIMHTLQDQVETVYATGTSSDEELEAAGVHDNATVVMKFRKGTVVTLFMSRSATYGYDQRCEIFGDKGLVSVQNVSANTTTISNSLGVHQSLLQHSFPQRFDQAFGAEIDAFADTILLGKAWPITREQCIRVQRVADAARLSVETGQVVQIVPEDENAPNVEEVASV